MKTFELKVFSIIFLFVTNFIFCFGNQDNPKKIIKKFDFGNGKKEQGFQQVTGKMIYNEERGFGFICEDSIRDVIRKGNDKIKQDFCTSNKPFYFVTDLPEGFYEIKITFGDKDSSSVTTVKAESRRLMLEKIETSKGEFITKSINVNVRTPKINENEKIRLKSREFNYLNWDNKLTLEFNNSRPCINAVEIIQKNDLITVFLAGNSTVVDQENEPWCSWGQMITRFLGPEVVVANYAESGEALKSFQAAKRFDKILSLMKPGDYLFIEFGHNDQKPQSSSYVEPFTGYKEELKKMVKAARVKGGIPVIVSSTQRRNFDDNGKVINTHGDYPLAAKQTAKEENVPFIDLTALSTQMYESLGVKGSKKAFVHYPAYSFPGQDKELADNSHFSPYGAYQIAKCILTGIQKCNLSLADYILDDFTGYDPQYPDDPDVWDLPSSPSFQLIKADGY